MSTPREGEPRSILVHLNVEVPADDERDADQIAEAVAAALEVGSDDESVRGFTYAVPLAEEV